MYNNTVMSMLVASENPGQRSCCRTLTSHLYTTASCPLPKKRAHAYMCTYTFPSLNKGHFPMSSMRPLWRSFPVSVCVSLFVYAYMYVSISCLSVCLFVSQTFLESLCVPVYLG